jgi:hypothetical protein
VPGFVRQDFVTTILECTLGGSTRMERPEPGTVVVTASGDGTYTQQVGTSGHTLLIADKCPVHRTLSSEIVIETRETGR